MATFEYKNLSACMDCVMFLSNGDAPEGNPDLAYIVSTRWTNRKDGDCWELCIGWHSDGWPEEKEDRLPLSGPWSWDDVNIDLGFSRSHCSVCGTRDHGDRWKACAYRWYYTELELLARETRLG